MLTWHYYITLSVEFNEKVVKKVRKIIDRYADGFFDYDTGKLLFSVAKIEGSIPCGEILEDNFTLSSEDGRDFSAQIFTSDMRLVCRNDSVTEVSEATIHYVFDSTGLESGDVVKGDIRIVSNAGKDACQSVPHLHFHILGGVQMADQMA